MTTDKAAAPVGAVPQGLPPLPEPDEQIACTGMWNGVAREGSYGVYSEQQMHEYARAALASQAARTGELEADSWQPISTAPLDGTRVLTCYVVGGLACDYQVNHFNDPGRRAPGHGLGSRGWWCSTQRQQPTHWRPLTNPADQGKRSAADPR